MIALTLASTWLAPAAACIVFTPSCAGGASQQGIYEVAIANQGKIVSSYVKSDNTALVSSVLRVISEGAGACGFPVARDSDKQNSVC